MCADDSGMGTKLPLCCHLNILLATVQVVIMMKTGSSTCTANRIEGRF